MVEAAVRQTARVVDLREPNTVLRTLADAKRRAEKGAPASITVRDLLAELGDALADSGPLELGVSPRRWVRAQARASGMVANRQDATAARDTDRSAPTMRELRSVFRPAARSARWRVLMRDSRWAPFVLFVLLSALLAVATWLIESLAEGQFSARMFAPAIPIELFFFLLSAAWLWSATEAVVARDIAGQLAPEERWLLNCRMHGGWVVIATDQRVLAAKRRRELVGPRLLWSVPYAEVTSFSSLEVKNRRVTLNAGGQVQQIDLRALEVIDGGIDYQKYHHKALLMILRRRASLMQEAKSEPAETEPVESLL